MGRPHLPRDTIADKEIESRRLLHRLRRRRYAEAAAKPLEFGRENERAALRALAEREGEIEKLSADNASLRDLALRARAELDNARKRMQREKKEIIQFANESLLRELIPIVDNLERALASARDTSNDDAIRAGVRMVLSQLVGILQANGLEEIASDGRPFDPHLHEAVAVEERGDVDENTIIDTIQKGYILKGRIVRAAVVRVARLPQAVAPVPVEVGTENDLDVEETLADLDDVSSPNQRADLGSTSGLDELDTAGDPHR